jgi:hypothetical protein
MLDAKGSKYICAATYLRSVNNQQETQINACSNVEQLKALFEYTGIPSTRPLAEYPKEVI